MKYCVNIIEYNSVFTCVEDRKVNSVSTVHAYLCTIFVKIFSVFASINFASPYYATQ